MLLFGGLNGTIILGDLWTLSLGVSPAWAQLTASGAIPSSRRGHTIIYDAPRDRFILFGGYDGVYLNDTWQLTLDPTPTWTQLAPTGTPPPGLYWHSAIYDPIRERMIVFAGQTPGISYETNDVYALSLNGAPEWTHLAPAGTLPTRRAGHLAVYDPLSDVMLVFGGRRPGGFLNDVWTLTLGALPTWSSLSPSGPLPGAREGSPGVYDPNGDQVLVFGGWSASGTRNDLWALSLSGPPAWTQITTAAVPAERSGASAIYASGPDRMILFGGNKTTAFNDAWAFFPGARIAREDGKTTPGASLSPIATGPGLTIESVGPNPFSSSLTLRLHMASAGEVRLAVFDVTGRAVRTWRHNAPAPGTSEIVWDGSGDGAGAVPSGVYFLRIESAGRSDWRKVIRLAR
jgi:hypothetical protein